MGCTENTPKPADSFRQKILKLSKTFSKTSRAIPKILTAFRKFDEDLLKIRKSDGEPAKNSSQEVQSLPGDCNMQVSAACYIHTTDQGTFSKIFRIHF